MKHEWEHKIKIKVIEKVVNALLPKGRKFLGVAIANTRDGNAALMTNGKPRDGVISADFFLDVMHDATAIYNEIDVMENPNE